MKNRSALVAALVFGIALPSFAQDGFRVGVQLGSMKTTGDNAPFAVDAVGGTPSNFKSMGFDQPNQSPLSLDLAIVKGDNEWSFTFFTTKKKTSSTFVDAANQVGLADSYIITSAGVSGSRELKATLVDVAWKRTLIKGDMGSFAISTGLRYSKQSDERSYQQLDAASNPTGYSLHLKGEGTGFGLTTGLHGRMNVSDRMWFTSGITAALINNTAKNKDYTLSQASGPVLIMTNDDVHQSLLQTDAYLRFNMNFVSSFNGYLGYEVRDFNRDGARTYANGYFSSLYGFGNTSGFGLSGFTLGLSYTF